MSSTRMLIFLADDDQDDREWFSAAFEKVKNIETDLRVFSDGLSLLNHLKKATELPHLIFLDINMPLMSGIECLKKIKENEKLKEISVAIYSTSNRLDDIEQTFTLGANIYINKPTDLANLQKILQQVLKTNWQFEMSGLSKETFVLKM